MSHISEYAQRVKDIEALIKILSKKKYGWRKGDIEVKQFGRNIIKAKLGFTLPGWRYEIAITEDGKILYDHFGSKKNTMDLLGETLQEYNEEIITNSALNKADNFYAETLSNGDRKLILEWF